MSNAEPLQRGPRTGKSEAIRPARQGLLYATLLGALLWLLATALPGLDRLVPGIAVAAESDPQLAMASAAENARPLSLRGSGGGPKPEDPRAPCRHAVPTEIACPPERHWTAAVEAFSSQPPPDGIATHPRLPRAPPIST